MLLPVLWHSLECIWAIIIQVTLLPAPCWVWSSPCSFAGCSGGDKKDKWMKTGWHTTPSRFAFNEANPLRRDGRLDCPADHFSRRLDERAVGAARLKPI